MERRGASIGARGPTRRAAVLGAAAAGLAGCAARRGPAPLTLWAMSYEGDYSPLLMPAFTTATGLPVEVQSLPWTAAHEKLLTAFAGRSLPDVMMLPVGWVGEFAMIGALAPVTDERLVGDTFPLVREAGRRDGRDYAVPWSVGTQGQFFRRDLLAEVGYDTPPLHWEEWRQMGFALKRRRPDAYMILMYLNWPEMLFTFAWQLKAWPLRDRDSRGNFSSPEFREALRFYKSLFDDGLAPRALSTEIQDPVGAFAQGYFAIYPESAQILLDLHRRAAEIPPARWGTARMPGPNGPTALPPSSNTLCVSAHARPEAWTLVSYLTSAATELRFQMTMGSLPARASAWSAPQLADPVLRPFFDQLHDAVLGPNIVEGERIRLEVQLVAERVVRGLLSIDAGAAEMDRRTDRLLAKRRALIEAGKIA